MTCREKWENANHGLAFDILTEHCPWHYGYLDQPYYCTNGDDTDLCSCCWDREIPEEPKKEKTMIEPIEHTCADCVHQDVCKHMSEFMAVKQTIADMYVVINGKTQVKLFNVPCVKAIGLQCKFYRKDVKTR